MIRQRGTDLLSDASDLDLPPCPGDASCGFCNGPMPCWCLGPTRDQIDEFFREDAEARNAFDAPPERDGEFHDSGWKWGAQ